MDKLRKKWPVNVVPFPQQRRDYSGNDVCREQEKLKLAELARIWALESESGSDDSAADG